MIRVASFARSLSSALMPLLVLATACGAPKQPASVLADETVVPSNKDAVQRFPDETPINERQYVEWKAAPVRASNPDGASMTSGSLVTFIGVPRRQYLTV